MTNEDAYTKFQILWHGGMRDTMLCPDPFAERRQTADATVERPILSMRRSRRDVVYQATCSRWRTRQDIAELTGYEATEVSQDLLQLVYAGRVTRHRTREGVWVYQRKDGV